MSEMPEFPSLLEFDETETGSAGFFGYYGLLADGGYSGIKIAFTKDRERERAVCLAKEICRRWNEVDDYDRIVQALRASNAEKDKRIDRFNIVVNAQLGTINEMRQRIIELEEAVNASAEDA